MRGTTEENQLFRSELRSPPTSDGWGTVMDPSRTAETYGLKKQDAVCVNW